MSRLRSSAYSIVLTLLLFAACAISAQAGVVSLSVSVEGTGPGSLGYVAGRGCTVKLVAEACDIDVIGSEVCWDYLEFPIWEAGSPPSRTSTGNYYGESTINVDWVGPRTFNFKADDLHVCGGPNHEDDAPAETSVTITGVDLVGIDGSETPTCPLGPCPEGSLEYRAVTNPTGWGHLVTWSGTSGHVPPMDPGAWHECLETPGVHTITAELCGQVRTKSIEVWAPQYSIQFLKPTGLVGGIASIQVEVTERCASLVDNSVVFERWEQEDPSLPGAWVPLSSDGVVWQSCMHSEEPCPEPQPDGTLTRKFNTTWTTVDFKNGTYRIRAVAQFDVVPDNHRIQVTEETTVEVKNLCITSVSPEGVVSWLDNGEPKTVTVNMEDNDLSDPITLTFKFWNTGMDNSIRMPDPDAQFDIAVPEDKRGSSYTLTLNEECFPKLRGLYTFQVAASQIDICNDDPSLQVVDDTARYRGGAAYIKRGVGETGVKYCVDYVGYEANGSPNELDHRYMFVIGPYSLLCSDGEPASDGEVSLYDPTLAKVASWRMADLPCVFAPENCDGVLHPGIHGLLVSVPVGTIEYGGTYRFVIRAKGSDNPACRCDQYKWSYELSFNWEQRAVAIHALNETLLGVPKPINDEPKARAAYALLSKLSCSAATEWAEIGYMGRPTLGEPDDGGSGVCVNSTSRGAVHTLDRLHPDELSENGEPKKREFWYYANASTVWGFYGHASPNYLLFDESDEITQSYTETPAQIRCHQLSIRNTPGVYSVQLAYLAGCATAGGDLDAYELDPETGSSDTVHYRGVCACNSIAAAFWEEGATSVVGFMDPLRNNPVFDAFDEAFWKGVCKEGLTVGEAVDEACRSIPLKLWYYYCFGYAQFKWGHKVVVWGGDHSLRGYVSDPY